MKKFATLTFLLLLLSFSCDVLAQSDSISRSRFSEIGLFPKKDPGSDRSIQISGYYRFFGTYNRMYDPYLLNPTIGDTALSRSLFIGDDSQLPNLYLTVAGRPSDRSSWSFDIMVFQFLQGLIGTSYSTQVADSLRPDIQYPLTSTRLGGAMGMLLGMNMHGSFKTKKGTLATHIGGIQWYNMSDLTMASFRGYNRFMLFERNPWDPTGNEIASRYKQYFDQGSIDQDTRWGNRAFVGAVIEGTDFPGRISFSGLIGKTELNGGFSQVPNFSYGGKVRKEWGSKNFIGVNTLNQFSYTDSLARENYGFHIATFEWAIERQGYSFRGEAGSGNYFSPINKKGWNELFQVKLKSPMRGRIPSFELHAYRISPYVVNNNALYWNTATPEYSVNNIPAGSVGSTAVLQPFGSSIVRLGQMTNNRQGLNLNIEAGKKKLRFAGGVGMASEIMAAAPVITYGHPVNSFTRSRFWRWVFPANVGPYNRYSDIFRDVYETVNLSDNVDSASVVRKHFTTMEAQLKYHTKLAGRDLYLFSLLQAHSVQKKYSPLVVTNDDAYIHLFAAEVEAYYAISRGFLINMYYGWERTKGNSLTDIDTQTLKPRNQYGEGVGVGCDIDMGKNTRLYLRHRWYYFRDESFNLDRFRGRELTLEIKAFF